MISYYGNDYILVLVSIKWYFLIKTIHIWDKKKKSPLGVYGEKPISIIIFFKKNQPPSHFQTDNKDCACITVKLKTIIHVNFVGILYKIMVNIYI